MTKCASSFSITFIFFFLTAYSMLLKNSSCVMWHPSVAETWLIGLQVLITNSSDIWGECQYIVAGNHAIVDSITSHLCSILQFEQLLSKQEPKELTINHTCHTSKWLEADSLFYLLGYLRKKAFMVAPNIDHDSVRFGICHNRGKLLLIPVFGGYTLFNQTIFWLLL